MAHYALRCPLSSLEALHAIAEKERSQDQSKLLRTALKLRQKESATMHIGVNGYSHDDWQNASMEKIREGLLASQGVLLMDIDGGDWQSSVIHQANLLFTRSGFYWRATSSSNSSLVGHHRSQRRRGLSLRTNSQNFPRTYCLHRIETQTNEHPIHLLLSMSLLQHDCLTDHHRPSMPMYGE